MTESELYKNRLKKLLTSAGWSVERIDFPALPDVYCMRNGECLWVEMKTMDRYPSKDSFSPDWRPGQLAWIRNHQSFGGLVLLCLCVENDLYFLDPKERYDISDLLECNEVKKNGKSVFVSGGHDDVLRFTGKT